MLIIGLTGGIGSGKTTVAQLFSDLGVPVIDTDDIARRLTLPGQPLLASIQNQFGEAVFNADGTLNRATLAKRIFDDNNARLQLEGILHPAIWQKVEQQIQSLDSAYCLLVVPLLLETKQASRVDRVLVVDTTEDLQVSRTRQRDHRREEDITAIIKSQVDRQTRLSAADDIIDNSDNTQVPLTAQVNSLHKKYLKLASQSTL